MLSLLLCMGLAVAGVQRFALLVGQNEGHTGTRPLLFAEDDATKMHDLLTDLGGVPHEQARLLRGGTRTSLLHALADLADQVAVAEAHGDDTVVFFYYSGHADAERLHLGRQWLTYTELEELLGRTGADVRLAFLDACQSGAMVRTKGGRRAPGFVFDLTERLDATGQVLITSSAADEASQESDEIGGSYFTHFLASALSGAADEDGDQLITLSEAYTYVYEETVFRTSSSRLTQHPTFSWELAGRGDVVLADLSAQQAPLVFPAGMVGRYAVFDQGRRQFVAEVQLSGSEAREVYLAPGRYLVQQRYPTHLEVAQVELDGARAVSLEGLAFSSMEYEDDVAKGAIDRRIRKARRPELTVLLGVGGRTFTDSSVSQAWFPSSGGLGLMGRWQWEAGPWLSADTLSTQATTQLVFGDLSYAVPVEIRGSSTGLSGGLATRPRLFQAGAGLRLAGTYMRRSFPGQDVGDQDLFTVAPGVVGWLALNTRPVVIDVQLRGHYLPYRLEGEDLGLGFTEALLTIGHTF